MARDKKPFNIPFKVYEVHWRDAVHDCENPSLKNPMNPTELVTIGYLVHETKSYINVACEVSPDGDDWARHISCIPMENIIAMWEL